MAGGKAFDPERAVRVLCRVYSGLLSPRNSVADRAVAGRDRAGHRHAVGATVGKEGAGAHRARLGLALHAREQPLRENVRGRMSEPRAAETQHGDEEDRGQER